MYDPIQRAIDQQLANRYWNDLPGTEEIFVRMIDLKYHRENKLQKSIEYLHLQGFTFNEIALLLGYSERWVRKLSKD